MPMTTRRTDMKWLVDVTVGVGDSEATLTVEVEADTTYRSACAAAEDMVREQMTIEAGNARPVED